MEDLEITSPSFRGHLLVAHPTLLDPNFRRAVVLVSEHGEDGAIGVILNRPLRKTVGDVREDLTDAALAAVPVFEGGPVEPDKLILTAWRWNLTEGTFQLYFGAAPEMIAQLRADDAQFEIRAYLGYSGWSGGQLELELGESAWLIAPLVEEQMEAERLEPLWRQLLTQLQPELGFLADAPDDPGLN